MPDVRSNYDPVLAAINTSQNHANVVILNKENSTQFLILLTQIK